MRMRVLGARQHQNQRGFASIIIAIVLVLVLSLLTVGFTQLMRREERSALDKHLSSQAYYAAEAGINSAAKAINAGFDVAKTACGPLTPSDPGYTVSGASYLKKNNVGTPGSGTSYPCLLVDPTPLTLEYGSIDQVQSKAVEITGVDAAGNVTPIAFLNIGWSDASPGSGIPLFVSGAAAVNHSFGCIASATCDSTVNWPADTGVLRVGLTPLEAKGGFIDRNTLINDTYTAFLYPNDHSSGSCVATMSATNCPTSSYFAGSGSNNTAAGLIVDGDCNTGSTPRHCNMQITNIDHASVLLDMRSIYKTSRVTISAYGSDGTWLHIKNAQVLVDSTGKAQDVLRRIQVRIAAHNNYPHTDYDLESMNGICKQLKLLPASFVNSSSNGCTP